MKLFGKKKLGKIAAKEMQGLFSEETLVAALKDADYSDEVACKEAKKKVSNFLGFTRYNPKR